MPVSSHGLGARVRLRTVAAAMLVVCTLGVVGAQRAAADPVDYSQTAATLGFPGGLTNSSNWSVDGTACETAGTCVTVGYYEDASSNYQASVTAITDGVPAATQKVVLPANAYSAPGAGLEGVSCSGNVCEAYGYYYDSTDTEQQMVVRIVDGVAQPAVEIPAPSASNSLTIQSVACSSSSACVAAGYWDTSGSGVYQPAVVAIATGQPGTVQTPTLPAQYTTPNAALYDVSCQSTGSCVAVGYYTDASDNEQMLAVPISNGAAGTGVEVSAPAGSYSSPRAYLAWVACPTSGTCQAVGYGYNSANQQQDIVVPISGGTPGTAAFVPLPSAGTYNNYPLYYNGLDCSSASFCVASGYYYPSSHSGGYVAASLLITPSGVTWDTPTLPLDAATSSSSMYEGYYTSVDGCVSSGPCLASGWYYTGTGSTYSGLIQQFSSTGQASAPVTAAVPADSASPQLAYLYGGTACVASGSCVATGEYETSATASVPNTYLPHEVSLQAPLSVTTSSVPSGAYGVTYQTSLAATGAWGDYTWSVASGALPAGLSLDASTGVISGTPTAAGTAQFTVKVTGGGAAAPSATQQFSLAVAAATVQLTGASTKVKGNHVKFTLVCSAGCSGTLKLTARLTTVVKHGKRSVRHHRTVVIGSASYSGAVGATLSVSVGLNAAGRRALAASPSHRLPIKATATINGGATVVLNETIHSAVRKHRKHK